jgi:hypothetical protein
LDGDMNLEMYYSDMLDQLIYYASVHGIELSLRQLYRPH